MSPKIISLSLHDALPICQVSADFSSSQRTGTSKSLLSTRAIIAASDVGSLRNEPPVTKIGSPVRRYSSRSEEHTSELQSHVNIVCRLLLEKKKENSTYPC